MVAAKQRKKTANRLKFRHPRALVCRSDSQRRDAMPVGRPFDTGNREVTQATVRHVAIRAMSWVESIAGSFRRGQSQTPVELPTAATSNAAMRTRKPS